MIDSQFDSRALDRPAGGMLARRLAWRGLSPWRRRRSLVIGSAILLVIVVASLLAPWISPYDPVAQDLSNTLQPPSAAHLFGTDNFGRDIFSRVLHAAKLDLQIGVLCVLFPWIIGIVLGCFSGYFGGWTDTVIMRTVDIFTAFPFLIIVIGIIAILGPGLFSMYIALTLAGWSAYARIARGEILVAKKSEYT
jgi:peptide/nickel transport system permease protein